VRLWSLHPQYLDTRGLVALWREALLAQQVLRGRTRGYRHHPQLERFLATRDPVTAIGAYLEVIANEAARRGYCFDTARIHSAGGRSRLIVTHAQLRYELTLLKRKLWQRDRTAYARCRCLARPKPHPLFSVTRGPVASWEVIH
jgi:hypothetical protein